MENWTKWLPEARQIVERCWDDPTVENREVDSSLAKVFAREIALWMDTAAQHRKNADYYRGLLERCGKAIGDRAFIADGGCRMDEVLCAKVPEIIEEDYRIIREFFNLNRRVI